MKTKKRYISQLISVVIWSFLLCFSWSYFVYYKGYEKGFVRGRNLTIELVNALSAEEGFEFKLVEE